MTSIVTHGLFWSTAMITSETTAITFPCHTPRVQNYPRWRGRQRYDEQGRPPLSHTVAGGTRGIAVQFCEPQPNRLGSRDRSDLTDLSLDPPRAWAVSRESCFW